MSPEEALRRGLITKEDMKSFKTPSRRGGKGKSAAKEDKPVSKSEKGFNQLLEAASSASYSLVFDDSKGHAKASVLTVLGFAAPSWNRIIRLEWWQYSKLNKMIKQRVYEASLESRANKQFGKFDPSVAVNAHCHVIRPSLTDLDNICAKHFIDGIVRAGGIEDDAPEFIKDYHATQEIGHKSIEQTIITLSVDKMKEQS